MLVRARVQIKNKSGPFWFPEGPNHCQTPVGQLNLMSDFSTIKYSSKFPKLQWKKLQSRRNGQREPQAVTNHNLPWKKNEAPCSLSLRKNKRKKCLFKEMRKWEKIKIASLELIKNNGTYLFRILLYILYK